VAVKKKPRPQAKPTGKPDPWQEAERYGFDMSVVEANLRKTPLERIRAHDRALSLALALRQAMSEKERQGHA
jgi:hypothetical protein